jgi:hypothetical protein
MTMRQQEDPQDSKRIANNDGLAIPLVDMITFSAMHAGPARNPTPTDQPLSRVLGNPPRASSFPSDRAFLLAIVQEALSILEEDDIIPGPTF